MALELVGGAFLSSSLNVIFEKLSSPEFINFFETQATDVEVFDELKSLLDTVKIVIDDAEDRQITSKQIKDWLDSLRDAAYEADDQLDEIGYEVIREKLEAEEPTTDSERVNFSKDQERKMKKTVRKLKYLVDQSGSLGLKHGGRNMLERELTSSVVEESGIFGRDGDKEAIIKLLQEDDAKRNNVGVIPIVGMGGIGKTTLAQLVYNDSQVQALFEVRAWVCVSENYDASRIKKEILKHTSFSGDCDRLATNQIDVELKKNLKDKRYLLVLDDMWNESYADWDILKTPLEAGGQESKIIITTRNQNVASNVCTIQNPYELRELDGNYCWLLFEKHAFSGGRVNDERLEAIGEKIVKKSKGLPLAAKILGGLLRRKREVAEWEEILNNNIWDLPNNDILPALWLSYRHLPSYLKQCFAYCAIFPKGSLMFKEKLTELWMAEGFLDQTKRGKKTEEMGKNCFNELVSRSFLQESTSVWDDQPCFVMHDLIHDLAQFVSREFSRRVERDNCDLGIRNRHISYRDSKEDGSMAFEISKAKFLRTFFLFGYFTKEIADEVVYNLIPCLRFLRVLSLRGFLHVVKLPDSLRVLKHLRYLDLTRTSLVRLPESVCLLYYLQTLILYNCNELVELPKHLGRLINLHYLDIRGTRNLQEMPSGMGNLKDLLTLYKFIVGKQNGSDLNELQKLHHLQGELSILKLENVIDPPKDVLKNKRYLEDLKLEWSSEIEDSMRARRVLDELQPYTSIKRLSISGYDGTKFADWVGDSSYKNMVSLKLQRCKYCTSLPPLGQLSFLEYLSISEFGEVVEVGAEFYGAAKTPFRTLKTLEIKDMSQWQRWIICKGNYSDKCVSFPKLERLTVWHCPMLESITTCESTHKIFNTLNEWDVHCCPNLRTSDLAAISNSKKLLITSKQREVYLKTLPSTMSKLYNGEWRKRRGDFYVNSEEDNHRTEGNEERNHRMEGNEEMQILFNALNFEKIYIRGNTFLQSMEMLPKLQSLKLSLCHNLKSLLASEEPLHQPLTSLTSLHISSDSLIYFPRGGIPAPKLTHLSLSFCSNLKTLPHNMHDLLPSLECLHISFCEELESFSEGGLPVNLKIFKVWSCDKFISGRLHWGLQRVHALSQLSLCHYCGDDLGFFPEQTLLPSRLSSLEISGFIYLQRLLGLPSSLSVLKIGDCPMLEPFSEGVLPINLQSLDIWRCNKLIGGRSQWGLQRLEALSHLSLSYYDGDDLQSFPEPALLPSSLGSLMIFCFENLKFINHQGLQHLNSLHDLRIRFCKNLQCLPEGLPSSLTFLRIGYCDLLKERCERDRGEDWPKISYISTVEVNGDEIEDMFVQ